MGPSIKDVRKFFSDFDNVYTFSYLCVLNFGWNFDPSYSGRPLWTVSLQYAYNSHAVLKDYAYFIMNHTEVAIN